MKRSLKCHGSSDCLIPRELKKIRAMFLAQWQGRLCKAHRYVIVKMGYISSSYYYYKSPLYRYHTRCWRNIGLHLQYTLSNYSTTTVIWNTLLQVHFVLSTRTVGETCENHFRRTFNFSLPLYLINLFCVFNCRSLKNSGQLWYDAYHHT